jgi:hypothetical protein
VYAARLIIGKGPAQAQQTARPAGSGWPLRPQQWAAIAAAAAMVREEAADTESAVTAKVGMGGDKEEKDLCAEGGYLLSRCLELRRHLRTLCRGLLARLLQPRRNRRRVDSGRPLRHLPIPLRHLHHSPTSERVSWRAAPVGRTATSKEAKRTSNQDRARARVGWASFSGQPGRPAESMEQESLKEVTRTATQTGHLHNSDESGS